MEAVQQKSLLTVVKCTVITVNGVHSAVETAVSLIGFNLHIISKAVGAAEIILCACIVNGRIFIIVYVHSGFAFHPAGVVSVHSGGQGHAHELTFSLNAIDNGVGTPLLNGMLLTVGSVEISNLVRHLTVTAGDDIIQALILFATVFHGDPAVLFERHLPVAVQSPSGSHQDLCGIEHRVFSIPVHKILIVCGSEKCGNGRFHGRIFAVVPVHADHEAVSNVAGKPNALDHSGTVGVHQRHRLPCANRHGRTELGAVSSFGTARSGSCGIFCGESEGLCIADHAIRFHRSCLPCFNVSLLFILWFLTERHSLLSAFHLSQKDTELLSRSSLFNHCDNIIASVQ